MHGFWLGATVSAVALMGLAASDADAADLYGGRGGMKDYGYRPALAHPATWYVRLDSAFAVHDAPVMVTDGITDLVKTGIDDTWTIGGGVGRYLSSNLRADFTVDYRFDTNVHGRNVSPGATFPGTHTFGLESTVLLANLYYDFNRGGWFNPYVGAGLGAVHHQVNAGSTVSGGRIAGSNEWDVAATVGGGFTIALHDRLSLDAGYRFLYMGDAKAGNISDDFGNVIRGPTVEDLHAHEFRLGLRWDIR
jgi:opacity protein-like surface antigen